MNSNLYFYLTIYLFTLMCCVVLIFNLRLSITFSTLIKVNTQHYREQNSNINAKFIIVIRQSKYNQLSQKYNK